MAVLQKSSVDMTLDSISKTIVAMNTGQFV